MQDHVALAEVREEYQSCNLLLGILCLPVHLLLASLCWWRVEDLTFPPLCEWKENLSDWSVHRDLYVWVNAHPFKFNQQRLPCLNGKEIP